MGYAISFTKTDHRHLKDKGRIILFHAACYFQSKPVYVGKIYKFWTLLISYRKGIM